MKLVCVPLTTQALSLLDLDACPESELEHLHLNEEEYEQLKSSGAIEAINLKLKKVIDDYEDENIQGAENLRKTLEILNSTKNPENSKLLNKLIKLNEAAIRNNTGIFFFF